MMRLSLFFVLVASSLRADALADLRANLAGLKGDDPVKASLQHQFWQESVEDKKPSTSQGQAQIQVEESLGGLRLIYPRALLAAAGQEAEQLAIHPGQKTPVRSALAGIGGALSAQGLLSGARALSNELASAQLVEERAEAYEGKPARLLLLKLEPKMSPSERKQMKSVEATGKLWIGADGAPLAFWRRTVSKASKFFISYEGSETEERRYSRTGNRLVTLSYTFESSDTAMGETKKRKTVTSLSLM